MRLLLINSLVLVFAFTFLTAKKSIAEPHSARLIMEKVENRDDGNNSIVDLKMILIDKNGKKRVREIRSYSREQGKDEVSSMFFLKPAEVKDTAFLNLEYKSKEDEQYLYLPALHKVKRIAGSDKTDSFMGSDLTYADMSNLNLDDFTFKIVKNASVRDKAVWVIQALPVNDTIVEETGYTESFYFIQKDNYVVVRSIRKLKGGKKVKYMDVKNLQKIDDIWTPTETHIYLKKGKSVAHQTILVNSNIRYNQKIRDDIFRVNSFSSGL